QRLEPVKADGDAVEIKQDIASRVRGGAGAHAFSSAAIGASMAPAARRGRGHGSCANRPTLPRGTISVGKTKRPPQKNNQISGAGLVSQVFARLTSPAPRMAPDSVPRPPTETQIAISIELPGENSLGLMIPTCGT